MKIFVHYIYNKMKSIKYTIQKIISDLILLSAKIFKLDLLNIFYNANGIGKYYSKESSGEIFVLNKISQFYSEHKSVVCFDVGANIGDYTLILKSYFPNSYIYAFEPNPISYKTLKTLDLKNFYCYQLGLSSTESTIELYDYPNSGNSGSEHSSIYNDAFKLVHQTTNTLQVNCKFTTGDIFCEEFEIDTINFLKIDVEGHEIECLRGCKQLIYNQRIDLIQFEFTQINVVSRVFLKDFYDLLNNYKIYRLDTDKLIPLFDYQVRNEIFFYQNFLAVNNNIHQEFTSLLK